MPEKLPFNEVVAAARDFVSKDLKSAEAEVARVAQNAPSQELSKRITTVTDRPGKRIRSTLMFLLGRTGGKNYCLESAARAAASIELVHTASLLHDDVIDDTEMRRGQKTAHERWGNRMAVLVGDYLLSSALQLVIEDEKKDLSLWISKATSKLVAGEVLEVDLTGKKPTRAQYDEIIYGKTAALVESAAACGACLAGFNASQIEACASMGKDFGMAFQIVDDLLDLGIGAGDLGKDPFADLDNGVMTLPMIMYREKCDPKAVIAFDDLLIRASGESSIDAKAELLAVLISSGACTDAMNVAKEYIDHAIEVLDTLPEGEARTHLVQLCRLMLDRTH
jgi:geranylgeranyl pyrophosphate synthase